MNVCNGHRGNTVYDLLADAAVAKNAEHLAPHIAAANALGIPFVIGEGNSCACGGQEGVSDVFGAALWAVDMLFASAAAGLQGFNFHGCEGGAYTAIAYNNSAADSADVRPLYYGMLAFTAATAHDSVIHNTTVTSSTNTFVKVWAARDGVGTWRLTAIHKDPNATAPAAVTVTLPAAAADADADAAVAGAGRLRSRAPTGTLVRLLPGAEGVFATHGVSWGGLTFDGSPDGRPRGTPASEPVPPNADGTYTFSVAPGTAAVVTLSVA